MKHSKGLRKGLSVIVIKTMFLRLRSLLALCLILFNTVPSVLPILENLSGSLSQILISIPSKSYKKGVPPAQGLRYLTPVSKLRGQLVKDSELIARAKTLSWKNGKAQALHDAISMLTKKGQEFTAEMMTLARIVKEYENEEITLNRDEVSFLAKARDSLIPPKIRQLFWSKTCYFRNLHGDEFLYAAGNHFIVDDFRQVFTWIPGGAPDESPWELKCNTKNATDNKCYVMNKWYSSYYLVLKKGGGAFDYKRRNVYANYQTEDVSSEWILSPVAVEGRQLFTLQNAHFSEYLYAANDGLNLDPKRAGFLHGYQDNYRGRVSVTGMLYVKNDSRIQKIVALHPSAFKNNIINVLIKLFVGRHSYFSRTYAHVLNIVHLQTQRFLHAVNSIAALRSSSSPI